MDYHAEDYGRKHWMVMKHCQICHSDQTMTAGTTASEEFCHGRREMHVRTVNWSQLAKRAGSI